MSVKAYFELVRIHNVIGSAVSTFMGFAIASGWRIVPQKMVIAIFVVALIAAAGYVINDVYDIEIDRINKPQRPLPSGKIKVATAKILAILFFVIGIILSLFLNIYATAVSILTAVSLYLYARNLKREGILGNLVVALTTALSAFYGGLAYFEDSWIFRILIPTIYIFFFTLAREFVKGIEDINGDMANGVKTLAVRLGIEKSWIVSKIIIIALLITSPLPYFYGFNIIYLVGILLLDIILILILTQKHTVERASKTRAYMKVYALGALVIFALGALRI